LERITSPDDPRIADFANIREAELVRARGVFIAEGVEVVRAMVAASRFPLRSILIAERHLEPMSDVLERANAPVYVAPQEVLSAIAGFDLHRGCLAAGERSAIPGAESLLKDLPARATIVAAEAIANHDNVGAIFRNAAAFGAEAVLLDPRCADPLYRKAIRVSMGHVLRLPFARLDPWPDALDRLRAEGFALWALSPRATLELGAWLADGDPPPPRVALLFGTEGEGLSAPALARAEIHARIEMAEGVDSLNVATAAAVALFAMRAKERRV
jgi:tRNA G18 (ribose-2'-O)-methylase SpoU